MTRKSVKLSKTLYVDQDFFHFLMNNEGIITSLLINLDLGNSVNYFAPTDQNDKISYLPSDKFIDSHDFDPFAKKVGRVSMKIGRFINKLLSGEILETYKISNHDIEKFVNSYKSWFDPSKFVLKVIEGEEIRKWYNEQNYFAPNGNQTGTLWNSCMRYNNRMKFLDLYCHSPNVKMLVMLQEHESEWFVRSRALLWDDVKVLKDYSNNLPDTIKVMDRIYSVFDSDVNTFKKWANQNDYLPKFEQNAKSHQFFDIKGEVVRLKCKIELPKINFGYYPYLDTFPFLNYSSKELSNDEFGGWDYKLVQANGSLEPPQQEEEHDDDGW